eukprot:353636_1
MSGQPQEQLTQGQINQRLFERMEKVEVEIVKEGANNLSTGQSRLMQYAEFILDRFTGEQEGVPFKIAILRQISSPAAIVAMNSGRAAHTAQHFMAEGIQLLLASGEFSGSVLPRTEFDIFVLGVASSGKTVEDHAHAFSFIAQTLVAANGVPNEFQKKNVHTLMNIFYGYLTHRVVLGMVSDATRKLGLATHWIVDMVKVEFDTLCAQRKNFVNYPAYPPVHVGREHRIPPHNPSASDQRQLLASDQMEGMSSGRRIIRGARRTRKMRQ